MILNSFNVVQYMPPYFPFKINLFEFCCRTYKYDILKLLYIFCTIRRNSLLQKKGGWHSWVNHPL